MGVDALTAEVRIQSMLAACSAGRILNPKSALSQIIGAMAMGAGAALVEKLSVDHRYGYFVNHDRLIGRAKKPDRQLRRNKILTLWRWTHR